MISFVTLHDSGSKVLLRIDNIVLVRAVHGDEEPCKSEIVYHVGAACCSHFVLEPVWQVIDILARCK